MLQQAKDILKKIMGYDEFRSLQEPVIENVLGKKDTVVIMPTGGGKSLCYQIPALIFKGLTIVISPLISLMKDQVGQLKELGVSAVLLNSSLSREEYAYNMRLVRLNETKLLYLAPETLLKPFMLEMLSTLSVPVDCLTIDEAHCISEWGHDFRPEYRQIADVRARFPNAVCIALTATATTRVREDIKETLDCRDSNTFVAGFDRENLFLEIVAKQKASAQLLAFIKKFPEQSGIVYCFTRKKVEEVHALLASKGIDAKPYHAGLPEDIRRQNQELFIRDDVQIIVATVAFGMGINKSNIRFVVHHDLPKNIESYYQEIGRAGRDGLRADCLLLFSYGDIQKIRYFIDQKNDQEQRVAAMHLNALVGFAETDICRRIPLLKYFGETYEGKNCGMCDNCLKTEDDYSDISIPAQKFLSCVRKTGSIFGGGHVIDVLRGSKSQKVLKFNHDDLSTYGIGKDISKKQWFHLSRQFIQKGLLLQDTEYGSLKVTQKGIDVLRGREKALGFLEEEPLVEKKKAANKQSPVHLQEHDRELFEHLRKMRKRLADASRLAPFMIFSDKSLMEMSVSNPAGVADLLDIHGVGEAKLKKYGNTFFKAIYDFRNRQHMEGRDGDFEAADMDAVPATPHDIVDIDDVPPSRREKIPRQGFPSREEAPPVDYPVSQPGRTSGGSAVGRQVKQSLDKRSVSRTNRVAPDEEEHGEPGKRKHHLVAEAFNRCGSIDEILAEFGVKEESVFVYLYNYLKEGNTLRPEGLLNRSTLSAERQVEVIEVFTQLGAHRLAPVYNEFNGSVSYPQLRVMQVYYLSCQS
ncbi:MAG: DNA helicase RecQ [bacterium]|nr:DNA helicase RecQ [bacterium]